MAGHADPPPAPDVLVVHENMRKVNLRWRIIMGITVAGVLALNLFVEITPENRIAATVLSIGAPVGFALWWAWQLRHPAYIEFSHAAIARKVQSSNRVFIIERTDGEVEFAIEANVAAGRGNTTEVLRSTHGGPSLPIADFDWPDVKRACEATGWTVVGDLPYERWTRRTGKVGRDS